MPPAVPPRDPLSGRIGHLSPEQEHILTKFRKEIQDEGTFVPERHDDPTLLRFLRARKFDLPNAKLMFNAAEEWRKDFGVDDIVKNFKFPEKDKVDQYYPQYYHKMDKDGRPIYIERLGQLDMRALYAATTQDRLLKRLVWEYEKFLTDRLPACNAAQADIAAANGLPPPALIETSCTILDLKSVTLSNFYRVKDYVSAASSIGQDRYPECMGKFYIINAPYLFSTVWSLIKGWLDEVTVAKIAILGSDYKTELLKQIGEENLPADFGGKCKCAEGCSLSDAGPWSDPKYQGAAGKAKEARLAAATKTAEVSAPTATADAPAPTPVAVPSA